MFTALLVLYAAAFATLAWKNFRWAIFVFIISLPSYLVRFDLGPLPFTPLTPLLPNPLIHFALRPLPTTLLELGFALLFLVWLIKYARADWPVLKGLALEHRIIFLGLCLFLISSMGGVMISDMWWYSFGQWRAYFLEPVLLFLVLLGRQHSLPSRDLVLALALCGLSVSVVAIIQASTGALYPPSLWDDVVGTRATSFFTTPNAVGLLLGPIFFLVLGLWKDLKTQPAKKPEKNLVLGLLGLGALGLLASQSVGAGLGVFVGGLIFLFHSGYKKTTLIIILLGLALLSLPPTQQILKTKTKSMDNRLTLWSHSATFLTASPKNFVLGAGIRQYFRKVEKPFYNPTELERLIYPHNIFLNFWTETGLFGMLSFAGLLAWLFWSTAQILKRNFSFLVIGLLAALSMMLAHGLVDVPYFKNDLAFLFWIITAIVIGLLPQNQPPPQLNRP